MAKPKSKLWQYFEGQFVQVLLDRDLESTQQDGDTVSIAKFPLTVKGYLVDEDDIYLYLTHEVGTEFTFINGAVHKDHIIHIEAGILEEDISPEMPNLELPKTKEGWN